ncbi:glycoside hydrolase family 117 protein [Anaerohalosphaera lusitana]|uniref:glycoside hydrolase family 117 protein n=1 Tax=Anaerohalosphaera lusitana TaxID=1936003 RepID=UPI001F02F3E5|nr:family 43 glycosylhydrolase [Anaerohalosphaera lusitana]
MLIMSATATVVGGEVEAESIDKMKAQLEGKTFRYQEVSGIGLENGITRRDPSDIIRVGETYYVWYTKVDHAKLPRNFLHLKTSGYVGTIWYATSTDEGRTWTEQGQALGLGKKGAFDSFAVFTPNIVKFGGKYYLYYTGVKPTNEDKFFFENNSTTDFTAIGAAVSDSPDGPFTRVSEQPALEVGPRASEEKAKSAFDSYRVDDAALLVRDFDGDGDEDVWLYYKGRNIDHGRRGPLFTKMGVAVADRPESEHVRLNQGKAILDKSHEVMIWPWHEGIGAYASLTKTIEYAPDGLDFTSQPLGVKVVPKPVAPACFREDLTRPVDEGKLISWGISMKNPGGPSPFLIRFELVDE